MTVGELKKILEHFSDDTPVLYAWTWKSPETVSKGSYLGAYMNSECCLLDGGRQYENELIYEGHPASFIKEKP